MREIKFRGKDIVSGYFVYGDLIHGEGTQSGIFFILPLKINGVEVDPLTVGEFTGLTTYSNRDIYEGDIFTGYNYLYLVSFIKGCWVCEIKKPKKLIGLKIPLYKYIEGNRRAKIKGNIYENPELLK